MASTRLAYYRDVLGFDETEHVPFAKTYRIRCSQCAAGVINGVPCHERGCPHMPHECGECGNYIMRGEQCCAVEG